MFCLKFAAQEAIQCLVMIIR